MQILIDNKSSAPIYAQIYSQIKAQIIGGSLAAHEMLPSIRGLAKDLRISFITTKRAYEELERGGFIQTVAGKGCYVAPKNLDFVREMHLKELEACLQQAVSLSGMCNVEISELHEMLDMIYKGE